MSKKPRERFVDCDYGIAQDLGRPGSVIVPTPTAQIRSDGVDERGYHYVAQLNGAFVHFWTTTELRGDLSRRCVVVEVFEENSRLLSNELSMRVLAVQAHAGCLGLMNTTDA